MQWLLSSSIGGLARGGRTRRAKPLFIKSLQLFARLSLAMRSSDTWRKGQMIPIEVRSKTKNLESKIRQYTERRIGFALDHLRDLRRIVVSVEDVNGPKGGPDKRCHIIAEYAFSSISLEEIQCNWQTAISRAIHRLDRTATNKLHRMNRSRSHRVLLHASKSLGRSMSVDEQLTESIPR